MTYGSLFPSNIRHGCEESSDEVIGWLANWNGYEVFIVSPSPMRGESLGINGNISSEN